MKHKPKKKEVAQLILSRGLKAKLRKESYRSGRSRSDIVREALFLYFTNR